MVQVFDWPGVFAVLGFASIAIALVLLGLLSKRLGQMTHSPAYHAGFHVGAFFVAMGVVARLINLTDPVASSARLQHNILWVLVYNGAPTIGVTLGVIIAWRYWSWLLAERG